MEMLIGGTWQPAASGRTEEVTSPFDRAVIGTVPVAGPVDVRAALAWRWTPTAARPGQDRRHRAPAGRRRRGHHVPFRPAADTAVTALRGWENAKPVAFPHENP
jgi:hypothetical protein